MNLLPLLPAHVAACASVSERLPSEALLKVHPFMAGCPVTEARWPRGQLLLQFQEGHDFALEMVAVLLREPLTLQLGGAPVAILYFLQSNAPAALSGPYGPIPVNAGFSLSFTGPHPPWELRLKPGRHTWLYLRSHSGNPAGTPSLPRLRNLCKPDIRLLQMLKHTGIRSLSREWFGMLRTLPRFPLRIPPASPALHVRVKHIVRYEMTRGRFLTVPEIAAILKLPADRLSRSFAAAEGVSLRSYLLGCRMHEARRLLRTASLPVLLISERLGYNHPSNFRRAFRKYFGRAPGDETA